MLLAPRHRADSKQNFVFETDVSSHAFSCLAAVSPLQGFHLRSRHGYQFEDSISLRCLSQNEGSLHR